MKRHGRNLNAYYQVKEADLKRPRLYGSNSDILKKAKQSDSDKSLDAGVSRERGVTTQDSEDV